MKNPVYPAKLSKFSERRDRDAYFKQMHDRILNLEARVEKLENPS